MNHITMSKFCENTNFDISLVRAISRKFGNWKTLVKHVKNNGVFNGKFGVNGFITTTENVEFYKKNNSDIIGFYDSLNLRRSNYESRKDLVDILHEKFSIHEDNQKQCSNDKLLRILGHYKSNLSVHFWYSYFIWYMLYELSLSLRNQLGGSGDHAI